MRGILKKESPSIEAQIQAVRQIRIRRRTNGVTREMLLAIEENLITVKVLNEGGSND